MSGLILYWHTLRHLKFLQIVARIHFRLMRPLPRVVEAELRHLSKKWISPIAKPAKLQAPTTFALLNKVRDLNEIGWDNPVIDKLWRYNLHYFDDLVADHATARSDWHVDLIHRWIAENPPAKGTGWEPYPTSLRIVNWIKWVLAGNAMSEHALQSLATQTDWLTRRLEYHLLGNHLFANAKALLFAGLFFKGDQADRWFAIGTRILRKQLAEQILPDGGHFELSPMYHAIMLEDVLDILNVFQTYRPAEVAAISPIPESVITKMRTWLATMTHPDGEIAFFNDASFGIAPTHRELEGYAERLGFPALHPSRDGLIHLPDSGYIRVQQGPLVAFLDVAAIGPDYLPGHAHADTLSFELSLFGNRVLVNSGTSEYGVSPERLRQRGTGAHNTVLIDGENSSEIWSGFRVARRARPQSLHIHTTDQTFKISCAHDGYMRLKGEITHTRLWVFQPDRLTVLDTFKGRPNSAEMRLYVSPNISLTQLEDASFRAATDNGVVHIRIEAADQPPLEATTWHPGFGLSHKTFYLSARSTGEPIKTCIEWR